MIFSAKQMESFVAVYINQKNVKENSVMYHRKKHAIETNIFQKLVLQKLGI